ncbi:hypothetical protein AB0N09_28255 [Streptomyces erythrochromogenes]|uniref:hypothetical protein n=1 Tax=Streptomyces erythrochromogenes TaxID=285574 RepID=UPI00343EA150
MEDQEIDEIRHPVLAGQVWPVIGVRVHREGRSPRAASWAPAPHAVQEDVLFPCTWPELKGLAQIAAGLSRARVFVRDLGSAAPDRRLVLCLRGAPGAVRVDGPAAAVAEILAARTRAATLCVAAVHREAGRPEQAQVWRARARQILKDGRAARRSRSVRATSAGLPTLGRRS